MAFFVLSLCPFDISVGIGAFVIGLGQISSFLSCAWPFYSLAQIDKQNAVGVDFATFVNFTK